MYYLAYTLKASGVFRLGIPALSKENKTKETADKETFSKWWWNPRKWLEFMLLIEVGGNLANMKTLDCCLASVSINYPTEIADTRGTSGTVVSDMVYLTWFLMLLDLCIFDTVNHRHHTWFSPNSKGGSFSVLRDLIINLKSLKSLKKF